MLRNKTPKKNFDPADTSAVRLKLARFCAYQERSIQEVRTKLEDLQVPYSDINAYIDWLIDEKYLNQERYILAVVRGKFRIKHWGKNKIKHYLRSKGIKDSDINIAIETEIPNSEYLSTLTKLISQYDISTFESKNKVVQKLLAKGYEYDEISRCMAEK